MTTTINEIKKRNEDIGHHFFDQDTMRWFRSKVYDDTYTTPGTTDTYFVTSEKDSGRHPAWNGERRYTVRAEYGDGQIHGVSEFGEYGTLRQARAAAKFQAGGGGV